MGKRKLPNRRSKKASESDNSKRPDTVDEEETESQSIEYTPINTRTTKFDFQSPIHRYSYYETPRQLRSQKGNKTPYRQKSVQKLATIQPVSPRKKRPKSFTREQEETCDSYRKELLNKPWKMCYLSSMHNFLYGKRNSLNSYEAKLKSTISLNYPFTTNIRVSIEKTFCFSLEPKKTDAVVISIKGTVPIDSNEEESREKTLYHAWLFTTNKHQSDKKVKKVKWFPLMFYTGRDKIHHLVTSWLSSSFGTYVQLKGMNQIDFTWVVCIWCINKCKQSIHLPPESKIVLRYRIVEPTGVKCFKPPLSRASSNIKLTFNGLDVEKIWKTTKKDNAVITAEEQREFHVNIENLISKISCLPASSFKLLSVATPCTEVHLDGRVILRCSHILQAMIKNLVDLQFEKSNKCMMKDYQPEDYDSTSDGFDDSDILDDGDDAPMT